MGRLRYETPALIDLNESAKGYGGTCGHGSHATWGCTLFGSLATTGCGTGSTDRSWCNPGQSGAVKLDT
ncbi:MAG: hypothetical protein ABFC89_12360 [Methanospirillum sp.]